MTDEDTKRIETMKRKFVMWFSKVEHCPYFPVAMENCWKAATEAASEKDHE